MTRLPPRVRVRMFLRSFAVQGSWNYETLIGAGFAYTILPALRHLYGRDPEALRAATGRHAELFNSHPYLATVAVGALSRLEAEGVDRGTAHRFKTALRGSLGSLGDRLVWTTWRPMSVLLGLALLLAGAGWAIAIVTFLIVYNALHLWVRGRGLRIGIESGLDVGRVLREAPFQRLIERASQLACVLVGFAVVLAAAPSVADTRAVALTVAAVAGGAWLGARARSAMVWVLGGLAAAGLLLGMMGYGA